MMLPALLQGVGLGNYNFRGKLAVDCTVFYYIAKAKFT